MKACQDCSKNDWWFKTEGGMTVATCKNCKNQLRWPRRRVKKVQKKSNEPDKCECGCTKFDREKVDPTIEVLRQQFYYTFYFKCKNCGNMIPDETTKRYNQLYR